MDDRPRTLLVAAGGGGDALAAMMLADAGGMQWESFAVASFAWERTMFDPRPGPRPAAHFTGLRRVGRFNWEITPGSRLRDRSAVSFLPTLAAEHHGRLLLMDAESGVVGMRRQLREAVTLYNADRVLIVDVGGDLLACGDEPKLSSPTADAMVLAATNEIGVPVLAVVVGLGLDGENISDDGQLPLKRLSGNWHGLPDELSAETARRFSASFGWSPSEATGLAYMVARGWRGTAEIRRGGQRVVLDSASAEIRLFDAYALLLRSRLAQDLDDTTSLEDVERVVSGHGFLPERGDRAVRPPQSPTFHVQRSSRRARRAIAVLQPGSRSSLCGLPDHPPYRRAAASGLADTAGFGPAVDASLPPSPAPSCLESARTVSSRGLHAGDILRSRWAGCGPAEESRPTNSPSAISAGSQACS